MLAPIIGSASALLPKAHKPQLRSQQQLPDHRFAWNNKGVLTLDSNSPKLIRRSIERASQDVELRFGRTSILPPVQTHMGNSHQGEL